MAATCLAMPVCDAFSIAKVKAGRKRHLPQFHRTETAGCTGRVSLPIVRVGALNAESPERWAMNPSLRGLRVSTGDGACSSPQARALNCGATTDIQEQTYGGEAVTTLAAMWRRAVESARKEGSGGQSECCGVLQRPDGRCPSHASSHDRRRPSRLESTRPSTAR
jgi:hypothetical protein